MHLKEASLNTFLKLKNRSYKQTQDITFLISLRVIGVATVVADIFTHIHTHTHTPTHTHTHTHKHRHTNTHTKRERERERERERSNRVKIGIFLLREFANKKKARFHRYAPIRSHDILSMNFLKL